MPFLRSLPSTLSVVFLGSRSRAERAFASCAAHRRGDGQRGAAAQRAHCARRLSARHLLSARPRLAALGLAAVPLGSASCAALRAARWGCISGADAPRVWRRVASQLLVVFATVWLWHFVSPSAASLPGYKGFGRFARARARCALHATRPMSTPALARALTRARARSSSPSAASPGSSSCGHSQSSQTWCALADALFPASAPTLLPCPSLPRAALRV